MRKLRTMPRTESPASAPTTVQVIQQLRTDLTVYADELGQAISDLQTAVASMEGPVGTECR